MEKFFGWLFTCEHIFTLATVLLSGLISWWISGAYFKKGNRNALRLNVLFPMRRIISEQRSWKNYKILEDTSKAHDAKYLTKKERTALTAFLSAYKNVCSYNYSSVCAESLFSYFCYKLEQNGINTKPVPIEIDDEIVDYEVPLDLLYLRDDLSKIIEDRPFEYDEEGRTTDIIKDLFVEYCKRFYSNDKIEYFDDYSLDEVLKKAKNRTEWDKKLASYKVAKDNFLALKVFENN